MNGKESEDVGMLLGPAGEAYFLGEEVGVPDNPYSEDYIHIDERQSRQEVKEDSKRHRSSSAEHHTSKDLQGVIDGAGIDIDKLQVKALDG